MNISRIKHSLLLRLAVLWAAVLFCASLVSTIVVSFMTPQAKISPAILEAMKL
ncbi:MAG: hypothetical protein MI742_01905 [Desulfobacterales bacterium]|nr:hypothetical protein [Desulfobacterales bacterium]